MKGDNDKWVVRPRGNILFGNEVFLKYTYSIFNIVKK